MGPIAQVIEWLREGLVPLADELNVETRLSVVQGDVYARLLSAPTDAPFDVILIDVDHSPEDQLDLQQLQIVENLPTR